MTTTKTRYLRNAQVAEILNVAPSTVAKWTTRSADPIPAHRTGEGIRPQWRYDPDELQAWMERRRNQ
ncbi:helix-turn-helix domain-containing protein [Corynebacterium pygosceleis]|uniref:helix-turn-helix domain-containing protein n=1 Tax=Corynebacterium pygosceleis TaxID=2800406 RepID=UPI002003CC25|nr:helix-turn-helix domain-containing protein [Corynebacterium pygosceleis]